MRAMASICFAGLLTLLESGCGGGTHTAPPPAAVSISTTSLADGMVTFPYSQTILATGGVAPFVWSVPSGSLPHNVTLASSSVSSVALSGSPDTAQTATFTIQVKDSKNQNAAQAYTINIAPTGFVQLQAVPGQVPAGVVEIQGVAAGPFNPNYWQGNTLNWVPDVRIPMFAALTTGPWQNIYAPWALEQSTGWRMFYGGWDGTATSNDRIYSVSTPDFLSFNNRTLVIDHGDFLHVNNANVTQLPDGSMHMICTTGIDNVIPGVANSKVAYFSSPDGITWNGTPEPYPARISDLITAIANDPNYPGWDFNGGNVLLRDGNAWVLYYSVGIYGGIDKVFRATSSSLPSFSKAGVALNTPHYSNDVKKFPAGGRNWYVMALYIERVTPDPTPPVFTFSLSNDGITFGPEQNLFAGAFAADKFIQTPSFVTTGNSVLGVLYGANPTDLLAATSQIFTRWLQKKIVFTDVSGTSYVPEGGYGPDRQWFQAPASGTLQGTIWVYAEDGITPLASASMDVVGEKSYQLVLGGG